jgi:hypothetical protein
MKQSVVFFKKELFPGSDIVRRYTFKAINTREKSALLARANHLLSQVIAIVREESAHFYKTDCFKFRSPHCTV